VGFGSQAKKGFLLISFCILQSGNHVGYNYGIFVLYVVCNPQLGHTMKICHATTP
jgi:hypothetical protein